MRVRGDFSIATNYEVKRDAPFDARMLAGTKADLTDPTQWESPITMYAGMIVAVVEDEVESNNGIYILKRLPFVNEANWEKLVDTNSFADFQTQIEAATNDMATNAGVDAKLAEYATTANVTANLALKANAADLTTLQGNVTAVEALVNTKVNATNVAGIIANANINGTQINGAVAIANQVASTLTVNVNGTTHTYNGNDAVSIDITAAGLGALTAVPVATNEALGGIKVGFTSAGENYAVQLDANNAAYVTVPAPELASERGTSADVAMSQLGIENLFYGTKIQLGSKSNNTYSTDSIVIGNGATASGYSATALGNGATASDYGTIALGWGASANSRSATALGEGAKASNTNAVAIGAGATASSINSIQLGTGNNSTPNTFQVGSHQLLDLSTGLIPQERIPSGPALASERGSNANVAMSQLGIENIFYNDSVQLGTQSNASGNNAIAIGYTAQAKNTGATVLGSYTTANGSYSIAIGWSSEASGAYAVALGWGAEASSVSATALGSSAEANSTGATAIGYGTTANGYSATALGLSATASGSNSTALGNGATASNMGATALGQGANASNASATALGRGATANGIGSTAIGYGAKAETAHTIVLGNADITSLQCQVQTISALSDSRVKEYVSLANTAQCLVDVNRLPVSRYKYKDFTGVHLDVNRTGFMADDVEKVFPKAVSIADRTFPLLDEDGNKTYEQAVDKEGNPIYEQAVDESGAALFNEDGSIKYDETKPVMKEKTFVMEDVKSVAMEMAIPTMWGAIQELTKIVESLKTEVETLKAK